MGHGRMASERLSREIVPPATRTARHGPYLLVRLRVRPEHDRVQSCAIALRSPASERSSDLKRYSPDIHPRHHSRVDNKLKYLERKIAAVTLSLRFWSDLGCKKKPLVSNRPWNSCLVRPAHECSSSTRLHCRRIAPVARAHTPPRRNHARCTRRSRVA